MGRATTGEGGCVESSEKDSSEGAGEVLLVLEEVESARSVGRRHSAAKNDAGERELALGVEQGDIRRGDDVWRRLRLGTESVAPPGRTADEGVRESVAAGAISSLVTLVWQALKGKGISLGPVGALRRTGRVATLPTWELEGRGDFVVGEARKS